MALETHVMHHTAGADVLMSPAESRRHSSYAKFRHQVLVAYEETGGPYESRCGRLRLRFASQLGPPLLAVRVLHVKFRIGAFQVFLQKSKRRNGLMPFAAVSVIKIQRGDVFWLGPKSPRLVTGNV